MDARIGHCSIDDVAQSRRFWFARGDLPLAEPSDAQTTSIEAAFTEAK